MNQKELDAIAEALRSQGLTWIQANFAVSLVRNGIASERERCAKLCEQVHADTGECPEMAMHCADRIRETASGITQHAGDSG